MWQVKSEPPNTQKAQNWKLWAATTGRQDFFRNSVNETFFMTLRSTSDVKMKEIEDVYFFHRVIFSKWGF
jgi:hypothetical protein